MCQKPKSDHSLQCGYCGIYFDMRDLSQAFHHGFGECLTTDEVKQQRFASSRKMDEPIEYLQGDKPVNLN